MKLTPAQKKVMDYLSNKENSSYDKTVSDLFNKKTLDNLLDKNIIKRVGFSRLRTDDMEMVYWYEFRVVNPVMSEME